MHEPTTTTTITTGDPDTVDDDLTTMWLNSLERKLGGQQTQIVAVAVVGLVLVALVLAVVAHNRKETP